MTPEERLEKIRAMATRTYDKTLGKIQRGGPIEDKGAYLVYIET